MAEEQKINTKKVNNKKARNFVNKEDKGARVTIVAGRTSGALGVKINGTTAN